MGDTVQVGVDGLRASFSGVVQVPGDAGYDEARAVWNAQIDRRPALIARCTTTEDVVAAVNFGRDHGLEIAVRGGGHNYSGNGCVEGGLMIHLGDMKSVSVDPARRRASVGGGATWADVDAATQAHGLAVPGGFVSHTGVGGLTLGGGIGWLTKLAGLSCDNVVSAEVVTAAGDVVRASATERPDLFWAIRGGGGNFGVVTTFEFALHPVGPMVNVALLFWELERGSEALRVIREVVSSLPDDVTAFVAGGLSAPPAPFVPEKDHFRVGFGLVLVGIGSPESHGAVVEQVRARLAPLWDMVSPIPYVALQQMFDDSAHFGQFTYEKALYVDDLSEPVIAALVEHSGRKIAPLSFCPTFYMDGGYVTAGDDATAFGGSRSRGYAINIGGHSPDAAGFEAERAWVRNLWDALRPYSSRGSGGYVNFQADADNRRTRDTYGAKYDRLAATKARYDPDNLFHLNANIVPV